ncbi:hypothetical protein CANINC_002219 [Pichia inconspicua]|uniref:Uncharacterized protein n=1 Tax=Pichia inconspicua TaxID=52247 RepID=A0A4T0X1S3_9ASCO|nr:hypothetical protein CANINC_002219 [[Candida] inconspicua]
MIAESYSKIGKLSQADKYKALIALAPNMDFVKGESYKFVGWYLYLKSKFIEASEGDAKVNAEKLFKTFEDYDKGAMAENQLSKDLLYVVFESIKSAKNKDVLVLTLGYPTNLSVFQTIFSKICYGAEGTGVTHDKIDGVKINLEDIKCLTWFHPLWYEMTETLQVNMFMNNMESGYKSKFITYLTTKGDHKVLKELSDKFKCLDDVFNALVEFEQDASYDAKVNLLNSMVIPLSIRMNRKDGKSKAPSTTNKGAGNNKKDGKAGNKKAATKESTGTAAVKSSAVHIGAAHTVIPVLIDSGASASLTPVKELIHGFESFNEVSIDFHGGSTHLLGIGYLVVDFDGFYIKTKVYYAPEATETVITEYDLLNAGCSFHVISREPVVKELVYKLHLIPLTTHNKVHYLPPSALLPSPPSIKICSIHTRFGHVNARYLLDSVKHETITDVSKSHLSELNGLLVDHDCHDCLQDGVDIYYHVICGKRIVFKHNKSPMSEPIECYTDSDYAQDVTIRKSMNGFMIHSNNQLVH